MPHVLFQLSLTFLFYLFSSLYPVDPYDNSLQHRKHDAMVFKARLYRTLWASLVAQTVESACSAGDLHSILGLGRSPGEGNGYPLQYFCLENSMHSRTWHSISKNVSLKFYTLYINIYFVIISDLQESKNSIKNSHLPITQIPQMLIFHPCYIILPSIHIYTSIAIFP